MTELTSLMKAKIFGEEGQGKIQENKCHYLLD